MKRYSGFGIVLSGLLALTGCGGGGGGNPDSSTGNDSTMGTDTTGDTTNPNDTGGGDSTMMGSDCATKAQRACNRIQMCTPYLFQRTYQDMARCVAVSTDTCNAANVQPLPDLGGVRDPAACEAALDNCAAYLNTTVLPTACQPAGGGRSNQGNSQCGSELQCAAGEYCYGMEQAPICQDGVCAPPNALNSGGNTCRNTTTGRDLCDTRNGAYCTFAYDANMPNHRNTVAQCRMVMYASTIGAECAPESNMQCGPGFTCDAASFRCVQLIGDGMSCDGPLAARCDTRLGLACQPLPNSPSTSTCRPTALAQIGAQCGTVTENGVTENRVCPSLVSRCNSATPPVCEELRTMGMPCTTSPDNCRTPFQCRSGTCQLPAAPMCN